MSESSSSSDTVLQGNRNTPVTCSLHTIVNKLSTMRKRGCPSETDLTSNNVDMSEDDVNSVSTAVSLSASLTDYTDNGANISSRRKSSHPCRYIQQLQLNEESEETPDNDDNDENFTPETLSPEIYKFYPFKTARITRGPISCIVRRLISEMMNSVVALIDNEPTPKRSGRRRKLWCSSISHLETSAIQQMALENDIRIQNSTKFHNNTSTHIHQPPAVKRRRGRPPQLGNLFSSPSSIIPKLLNDIVNAVCFEIDGMATARRRGRPPLSSNMSGDTSGRLHQTHGTRVRRARGRPPYVAGSRRSKQGRILRNLSPTEIFNSFFPPLLQAAGVGQIDQQTLSEIFNAQAFNPSSLPNSSSSDTTCSDSNNIAVKLIQQLPEALSQLAVAQTFQQTVAAAALAAASRGECSSMFGTPSITKTERRRGRRPYGSSTSITHENLANQILEFGARASIMNLPKRRGRGGRPRGSSRSGSRIARESSNAIHDSHGYMISPPIDERQEENPKQNGASKYPWFSL